MQSTIEMLQELSFNRMCVYTKLMKVAFQSNIILNPSYASISSTVKLTATIVPVSDTL